jgi:hypothetical protein
MLGPGCNGDVTPCHVALTALCAGGGTVFCARHPSAHEKGNGFCASRARRSHTSNVRPAFWAGDGGFSRHPSQPVTFFVQSQWSGASFDGNVAQKPLPLPPADLPCPCGLGVEAAQKSLPLRLRWRITSWASKLGCRRKARAQHKNRYLCRVEPT